MTAPDAICDHMRPRNKCLHCLKGRHDHTRYRMTDPAAICDHMVPRNQCVFCCEELIAMPLHTEHLKRVLLAKHYRHDRILDLWISPKGEWYHLCADGVMLRVSAAPLAEHDPAPRSIAGRP